MDPLFEFVASQLARAMGDTQASVTAAGYLHTCLLKLFQNPLAINQNLTKAEVQAAIATLHTGYADVTVTWGAPTIAAGRHGRGVEPVGDV